MDSRTVIRLIEADGWFRVGQNGSHIQFRHPTKPGRTTVPHPKRDFPIRTLIGMEQQSGVRLRKV